MRFEIVISYLDYFIINKVIELRIKSDPYLDQVTLAHKIGVSEGYLGKIENPKEHAKYNIRLLGRVAIALGLNSYCDLLPKDPPKHDLIKIVFEERKNYSNKHTIGKNGGLNRKYVEISQKQLTENEISEWVDSGKPYVKILQN
ncbi:hypothetical protein J4E06_01765 [Muricauda sp. NFXS6]|uniref:hypothetical protein n=1 Tax=Allomuricauda sp. NFXS6 TaxID=2819094 RepID=UPI0032DE5CB6